MRIIASNNEPYDFCARCFPKDEEIAYDLFGNLGDGPDDRGNCFDYDSDHPSYNHSGGWYHCHECGEVLNDFYDSTWHDESNQE